MNALQVKLRYFYFCQFELVVVLQACVYSYVNVMNALQIKLRSWPQFVPALYFDLGNLIFLAILVVLLRVFVYSYVNVMNALQMNWRSWPQWSASKLHEAGNISHLLAYHIHSCTQTYPISSSFCMNILIICHIYHKSTEISYSLLHTNLSLKWHNAGFSLRCC